MTVGPSALLSEFIQKTQSIPWSYVEQMVFMDCDMEALPDERNPLPTTHVGHKSYWNYLADAAAKALQILSAITRREIEELGSEPKWPELDPTTQQPVPLGRRGYGGVTGLAGFPRRTYLVFCQFSKSVLQRFPRRYRGDRRI